MEHDDPRFALYRLETRLTELHKQTEQLDANVDEILDVVRRMHPDPSRTSTGLTIHHEPQRKPGAPLTITLSTAGGGALYALLHWLFSVIAG